MRRADKTIDEVLVALKTHFLLLRQRGFDDKLFDFISSSEALAKERTSSTEVVMGPRMEP